MLEKLKVLLEWMPVISALQEVAAAPEGQQRAIEVAKLAGWLTEKTHNKIDDRLCRLIHDILLTSEGGALVDYLADLLNEVTDES